MSLLSSPADPELIRQVAFGKKPSADALHATGVDIELLEAVYNIVKPSLDFFPGIVFTTITKDLERSQELSRDRWPGSPTPNYERFEQVIALAHFTLRDEEGRLIGPEYVPSGGHEPNGYLSELRVYLSKRGEWIVIANFPGKVYFGVSHSPRKAVETAYAALPEGIHLDSSSLALRLMPMLASAHERHVEERDRRLYNSRADQIRIDHLMSGL